MICLRGATWRLYPCQLWPGTLNKAGYGTVFGDGVEHPKFDGAHRQALAQKLGRPIRQGYLACHHCDVKCCIQPEHLYEGTRRDNVLDARERRGSCGRLPSLSADQQDEVRRRYAAGGVKQSELAEEFAVTQKTISNVIRRVYSYHLARQG